MKYIIIFLLSILILGCSTNPTPLSSAIKAPSDRVLSYMSDDGVADASVVIIRDKGFYGSGCYYAVYINNSLAARLDVSEYATFFIEPGEVTFKAGRDPYGRSLCGKFQEFQTETKTVLKSKDKKKFRLKVNSNGKPEIIYLPQANE